jgi:hypothetical protein
MGAVRFVILILLFSSSQMVAAGLYKCKSASGILYSQKPCAPGSESQRLKYMPSAPSVNSDTYNKSSKVSKTEKPNIKITESGSSVPYIRKVFKSERDFVEYAYAGDARRRITDPEKLLDSGTKSFKLVLDDIYEEMGRPALGKAFAKSFDRKIFSRRDVQAPRFEPDVSISWITYSNRVSAIISCCAVNRAPKEVRVIWRPDQSIEIVQN